jgi:hypothetical protein
MKKITIIWIVALIFNLGCTQKKPVEKTIFGMGTDYMYFPEVLNGKVKELRETNYWAAKKDGKIIKGDMATWKDLDSIGSTRNLIAYFDINGTLTKYELLDENNVIRNSTVFTIENGKYVRFEFKIKDSTNQYVIPEYDSRGYIAGGKVYRPKVDTLIYSFKITNDDKGNYTRIENFDFKNQKASYQVFTLNDLGKIIETKFFNKYDTLRQTFINTYNDKGFLATQKVYIEKPKSTNSWDVQDLEFDDHGNALLIYSIVDEGKFKLVAERTYVYY